MTSKPIAITPFAEQIITAGTLLRLYPTSAGAIISFALPDDTTNGREFIPVLDRAWGAPGNEAACQDALAAAFDAAYEVLGEVPGQVAVMVIHRSGEQEIIGPIVRTDEWEPTPPCDHVFVLKLTDIESHEDFVAAASLSFPTADHPTRTRAERRRAERSRPVDWMRLPPTP